MSSESAHQQTNASESQQSQAKENNGIDNALDVGSIIKQPTTNLSTDQILHLQRTIGNLATVKLLNQNIQRHPSHAEEEQVQTKRYAISIQRHPGHAEEQIQTQRSTLQRHPSHAEEEQVQTKRDPMSIQRHPGHAEEQIQTMRDTKTIQRIPQWVKNLGKAERIKEGKMTAKYGIQIGNGGTGKAQFSMKMLKKLDKALSQLPLQHLTGTKLQSIILETGDGNASGYTYDSDTTGHIGLNMPDMPVGGRMPQWLFLMLNKNTSWQRKLMDEGAMADYTLPNADKAKQLGIDNEKREVMSGISDVMSKGNMADWVIRHEMGHAVDHKIKFTETRAKLPQFGGWKQFDHSKQADADLIAKHLLTAAGFTADQMDMGFKEYKLSVNTDSVLTKFSGVVMFGNDYTTDHWKENAAGGIPGFEDKWADAIRRHDIGKAQPWTFADGGAQHLKVGDRVLHMDHYGTWVSYDFDARKDHGLSNYQFSSPGEWFAEAYAAFYDPKAAAKDRLTEPTKAWFLKNLGSLQNQPKKKKKAAPVEKDPELLDGLGNLKELVDLSPDLLQELKENSADIADVPEDLKADDENMVTGF